MSKRENKQPTHVAAIKFMVRFEDGQKREMTVDEIAKLQDRRRYDIIDQRTGKTIMKKTFVGV